MVMKLTQDDDNRIILSGPPGGKSTVILLLAVGTAFFAGAWLFGSASFGASSSSTPIAFYIIPFVCGAIGAVAFFSGVIATLSRDRLVLDKVTNEGRWTRTCFGKALSKPIEFELRFAKHVKIERFTEAEPNAPQGGTGGWTKKSRARLLISKPRRAIVLAEVERQNEPKIRETAQRVADFLELQLEGPSGSKDED